MFYFNSRDELFKKPFGAVKCGCDLTFTLFGGDEFTAPYLCIKKGHPFCRTAFSIVFVMLSKLEDNREGVGNLDCAVSLLARSPLRGL